MQLHVGPLVARLGERALQLKAVGRAPRRMLRDYMARSFECRTAMIGPMPVAMWGYIGSDLGAEAYVWSCITNEARRHRFSIVREACRELTRLLETKHVINGIVLGSDMAAIRFARFLGFEVRMDIPIDDDGVLCHPIRMAR